LNANPPIGGQPVSKIIPAIKRGIGEGDISDEIDVDGLARTIWSASLGNRVLADALGDDIFGQLLQIWRVLLRAIVPAQSLPYFCELVARLTAQYEHHTTCLGYAEPPRRTDRG
jgi:hypothetical protein